MALRAPRPLIRPLVQRLHAYVPGEQPKIPGLIKLNTNENPYPPSPKVLTAVKAAVDGRLRLYPNPTASGLREKLAKLHGCAPENIIVGNGSDELLALATRTFVEPVAAQVRRRTDGSATESASSPRRLPRSRHHQLLRRAGLALPGVVHRRDLHLHRRPAGQARQREVTIRR